MLESEPDAAEMGPTQTVGVACHRRRRPGHPGVVILKTALAADERRLTQMHHGGTEANHPFGGLTNTGGTLNIRIHPRLTALSRFNGAGDHRIEQQAEKRE
ncbi:MAG TPA: hypothetical protein VJ396_00725 [Acidiferrobacterales bacterium]|nr:hypothetical protein [Acidiferrobacterales bacterium]